jgi:hypothetical protein
VFVGSIPAPMRSIVRETAMSWPRDAGLWVPCCGNMTIERSVADLGFELHSSDVSVYTTYLGRWLAGDPTGIHVRAEFAEEFDWIEAVLDDGITSIAALMLATRFLGSVGKAHLGHPYHVRVVGSYRRQWDRLIADTVRKLSANTLRLASYDCEDVSTWLDKIPADAPVMSFPPFYGGGYETLYAPLEAVFDWTPPHYRVLSEQDVVGVLERITDRPHWLTASNHRVPDLEPYLTGRIQPTPRSAPFWVYSAAHSRVVAPAQTIQPVTNPRLDDGELTGKLTLAKLTQGQFNALRSKYLNAHIAPGSPQLGLAVLDAGRIIGVIGYAQPKFTPDCAYLLSDFPVAPTRYKHLAKLVLLAGTSDEAKQLIESALSKRLRSISTTAFSDHPVSMKYRGIGKLTSRSDTPTPPFKYQLNYDFALGGHTLAEGYARWAGRWAAQREIAA